MRPYISHVFPHPILKFGLHVLNVFFHKVQISRSLDIVIDLKEFERRVNNKIRNHSKQS